jgi:GDPmannose 4,6-dehydratase
MGDLANPDVLKQIIYNSNPDVVINLVSLSSVFACQLDPELSNKINYEFVTILAEHLNQYSLFSQRKITLLQASSSEIFGSHEGYCDESTELRPVSKYGIDKAKAHEFLENASYDSLDIKLAILFNHESEYRAPSFVSQKISIAGAKYRLGIDYELKLGNVASSRDWGYAPDYMGALAEIVKKPGTEKYVIASGELHSIEDLVRRAFNVENEFDVSSLYTTDSALFRKNETKPLIGCSRKINADTGWRPTVGFSEMIEKMVACNINLLANNQGITNLY